MIYINIIVDIFKKNQLCLGTRKMQYSNAELLSLVNTASEKAMKVR
ncbi:hypothetical protein QUF50_09960 [Thiotrichales bacterium HSG1]|nr:hypothetical protein [Thiotrichales bacterium HSG1]